MSNEIVKQQQEPTAIEIFSADKTKAKFNELMGKRAPQFITSILQIVTSNVLLKKADGMSIYNAACIAASLDLPINNNLGFAWIVPYNQKFQENGQWKQKTVAQFQLGWKGFVQLALRTGQYQRINVVRVYENQFKGYNVLTEDLDCDFNVEGIGRVVGYAAYFKLNNGFEKLCYWSREAMEKHGKKYSKSYSSGVWSEGEDGFDAMALKTALKNTLSKWGILSIEMQTAITTDQALIEDENGTNLTYIDNQHDGIDMDKSLERAIMRLEECNTIAEVQELQIQCPELSMDLVNARVDVIISKSNG